MTLSAASWHLLISAPTGNMLTPALMINMLNDDGYSLRTWSARRGMRTGWSSPPAGEPSSLTAWVRTSYHSSPLCLHGLARVAYTDVCLHTHTHAILGQMCITTLPSACLRSQPDPAVRAERFIARNAGSYVALERVGLGWTKDGKLFVSGNGLAVLDVCPALKDMEVTG